MFLVKALALFINKTFFVCTWHEFTSDILEPCIDVVLESLLLILNGFRALFWCFYC